VGEVVLFSCLRKAGSRKFATVLADPPWQFQNRTGKRAPEHKRLARYPTLTLQEIKDLPVEVAVTDTAHLYLWVPNALLAEGLQVMRIGDALTRPILSDTSSGKTVARTGAV
jgi:N6-adenosine-specific RNA methylase IME4